MDSDSPSPTRENDEPKAEFRKLTNEAANRKYRRRSPSSGSSDENGSPKRDYGSRGNRKVRESDRRNDDRMDDKSFSRRSSESYRQSSRGYHNRHDNYHRLGKYADEDDRNYVKSSSRSGRELRGDSRSDYRDRESDYDRPRDNYRDVDRYSRDRSDADRKYKDKGTRVGSDERHGNRYDDRDRLARSKDDRDEERAYRSSRDHRRDRTFSPEDSREHRTATNSKREMGDGKDLVGLKHSEEGKNKNDVLDRHEEKHGGDRSALESENLTVKGFKFNLKESVAGKADEIPASGHKEGEGPVAKVSSEYAPANGSDSATNVDGAKVAAMKAAELVNKNLSGTGFMTADQKKKLLWGNKKTNATEESSHRWDTTMFSDRERQEKFNKLMGVKGEVKMDSKPTSSQDAEKQRELQLDLEKQYTAGLRRRDGRTVGLGL